MTNNELGHTTNLCCSDSTTKKIMKSADEDALGSGRIRAERVG